MDHFLVYLGADNPAFKTKLPEAEVFREYQVNNLHELNTDNQLSSQAPEEIIEAILSDYPVERIESVLRLIVKRLKEISKKSGNLDKYLHQLLNLSRLHKMEAVTTKIINEMSLLVDIEKDTFYIQGMEKGNKAAQRKMIINLINKLGLDDK
jgi:hypothetical protein